MNLNDIKYHIPIHRTLLMGCGLLFCGIFTLLLISTISIHELEFSDIFLLPVIAIFSIATNYLGFKTIFNYNKFIQLELNDNKLKFLIVGKGKAAGLNYYIMPKFETIEYKNIIYINIVKVDLFDNKIQMLLKDNSIILLPFLYNNIIELEEVINEIKKRLK